MRIGTISFNGLNTQKEEYPDAGGVISEAPQYDLQVAHLAPRIGVLSLSTTISTKIYSAAGSVANAA